MNLGYFTGFTMNLLKEQEEISSKNKEKIKEAEDRYWSAVNLPRKLKKKVRKEANIEYIFWKAMDRIDSNIFNY